MNLGELDRALTLIGVDPRGVALGGRADYCWCAERGSDDAREVYWHERGNGLVRLPTEADACYQLLGWLSYSQLIGGVDRSDRRWPPASG